MPVRKTQDTLSSARARSKVTQNQPQHSTKPYPFQKILTTAHLPALVGTLYSPHEDASALIKFAKIRAHWSVMTTRPFSLVTPHISRSFHRICDPSHLVKEQCPIQPIFNLQHTISMRILPLCVSMIDLQTHRN
jgi:hypothetical protein